MFPPVIQDIKCLCHKKSKSSQGRRKGSETNHCKGKVKQDNTNQTNMTASAPDQYLYSRSHWERKGDKKKGKDTVEAEGRNRMMETLNYSSSSENKS